MELESRKSRLLGIYVRGIAMGAADVVPGVSGGTIAFITGIYDELIDSIKGISPRILMTWKNDGLQAAWQQVNGNFLLVLVLGIATSILSLSRLISYLLEAYPLLVWSFFFGLIVASSLHMIKQIKQWDWVLVLIVALGCCIAIGITQLKPAALNPQWYTYALAGSIAICAMILPGISGSFILLLMGMYSHILNAVRQFDWLALGATALGAGIGILCFSHVLSWLLHRYHDRILALLTGFLLGSLNVVWPWKYAISFYQNSQGEELPLQQANVFPWDYFSVSGVSPSTLHCIILAICGFSVVLLLEKVAAKGKKI